MVASGHLVPSVGACVVVAHNGQRMEKVIPIMRKAHVCGANAVNAQTAVVRRFQHVVVLHARKPGKPGAGVARGNNPGVGTKTMTS